MIVVIGGQPSPFRRFIQTPKTWSIFAWTVALTRIDSRPCFRRGGAFSFCLEELRPVFDPRGGAWLPGKYIPVDAWPLIGGVIGTTPDRQPVLSPVKGRGPQGLTTG